MGYWTEKFPKSVKGFFEVFLVSTWVYLISFGMLVIVHYGAVGYGHAYLLASYAVLAFVFQLVYDDWKRWKDER